MSEVEIKGLRLLRARAETLLKTVVTDLSSFRHGRDNVTFVRKPDSPHNSKDVNITTTCSCLMALALTNNLEIFYASDEQDQEKKKKKTAALVDRAFDLVIKEPWRSSGLSENNAFTTTLVLRLLGFLEQSKILEGKDLQSAEIKYWAPNLGISDFLQLANAIFSNDDPLSQYLFRSFTDSNRDSIRLLLENKDSLDDDQKQKISDMLAFEMDRIIHGSVIYEESRFANIKLSPKTETLLQEKPTGYHLSRLHRLLLGDAYPAFWTQPPSKTLKQIAVELGKSVASFSINQYPPAAAVIYWFIDGVSRAGISMVPGQVTDLCGWARDEFNRQRSLVTADHDAVMDPIAMAMAACLCSRLTSLVERNKKASAILPTKIELENSVLKLFGQQTKTGIWPKYFPMFHYQEAGSNFCFTFEMLEAVLVEFGECKYTLFNNRAFINGLEKAVTWCEKNRLQYKGTNVEYDGWNSGGDIKTLKNNQPESWATAVVHMFLWELKGVLSKKIQELILIKYKATKIDKKTKDLSSVMDIEVFFHDKPESLKKILKDSFIDKYSGKQDKLRQFGKEDPRSALFFGPPGTSKTGLAKSIAAELEWKIILIDPSHFLKKGIDKIYIQADRIFADLMDLTGVVVFFDEMDALVQTRDSENRLDTSSQFLTTFMLPKLAGLHDQARVIFLMATNFQENFDAAIKRAGRFDLLLCIGPPPLKEKLDKLHMFWGLTTSTTQTEKAANLLRNWLNPGTASREALDLYTFGELSGFLKELLKQFGDQEKIDIGDALEQLGRERFFKRIDEDSKYVELRLIDFEPVSSVLSPCHSLADFDKKELSFRKLRKKRIEITPIIRYALDRRGSKKQ
jgi:hypothetical protein